jgi:hypothetical protein
MMAPLALLALLCSIVLSDFAAALLPGDVAEGLELEAVSGDFAWQPDSSRAVVILAMQQGLAFHDAIWGAASIEASSILLHAPRALLACASDPGHLPTEAPHRDP